MVYWKYNFSYQKEVYYNRCLQYLYCVRIIDDWSCNKQSFKGVVQISYYFLILIYQHENINNIIHSTLISYTYLILYFPPLSQIFKKLFFTFFILNVFTYVCVCNLQERKSSETIDAHKSLYTKYGIFRLETGGKDKRVYLMDGLLPLYFLNCVNFGFRSARIV